MPIAISAIRAAAVHKREAVFSLRNLEHAQRERYQTAFLCHSHEDREIVTGVIELLNESGWRIYVDWADSAMPETPDRTTAARIQSKIIDLNFFLFLATPGSMKSRWCPWEIGFADAKKNRDRILIIPTTDESGRWHGSEYLQLYRKVDIAKEGGLAAWRPGEQAGVFIKNL